MPRHFRISRLALLLISLMSVIPDGAWATKPRAISAPTVAVKKASAKKRPFLPLPERLPSGGRLRVQTDYNGSSWDWNHDGHRIPAVILRALHRGLYRIGASGIPERDLVDSETASIDAKVWTFRLKDDVVWSDGTPFTAAHAAAGLLRAAEPGAHEPPDAVKRIEGFVELRTMSALGLVGVEAESEHVLKIRLRDSDPDLPMKLHDPRTFPSRPDLFEAHSDYGYQVTHMAFLGPWMLSEAQSMLRAKLRRNPRHAGTPDSSFREIELWFVSGARAAADLYTRNHLDALLGPIDDVRAEGVRAVPRTSLVALVRSPQFESRCPATCMAAISGAIDRSRIVRLRPADSWVPPELWLAQQLGDLPAAATLTVRRPAAIRAQKRAIPGVRLLRIGIPTHRLVAADVRLLQDVAKTLEQQLKSSLEIEVTSSLLTSGDTPPPDLLLQLTDALSPALDTFLAEVEGPAGSAFWSDWRRLPIRSLERMQQFTERSQAALRESGRVIPVGFGLEFRRLKPYLTLLPF